MKRIFTLITFLTIAFSASAQWPQSSSSTGLFGQTRFSVTSMSNTPIRVMIDGRWLQDQNNEIRLSNLTPGSHRVQIYSMNRSNRRDRDNRNRGYNNRNGDLIYNVNLSIRPGVHTDIVINRFGKVFVDEQTIDFRNDDNWNNDNRWDNDNRWNNDGWNNNRQGQVMDNNRFMQFKQMVQREGFDDNKLNIIKSTLPNNLISSTQVKELVQLMSFEQNKLELAKYAYRYTADRNNYFIVNDAFSFGSSKTDLSHFILNYRD
jgi:Domain of unknown function (DUF4476)